jgi:sigma-B regulation protein RsbU (phosphoserine phosphatase)
VTAAGRVGTGQLLLKPGDRLVLYTDGVTDAIDESGRFFSEASPRETLRSARGLGCKEVIERVLEQVHRFSGGAPQADDITLLVLGYVGPRDGVET